MSKRPVYITVISFYLIISSALAVFGLLAINNNPLILDAMSKSLLPVSIQVIWTAFSGCIIAICGIYILKGKRWSRNIYSIVNFFGLIVAAINTTSKIIILPSLLIYALVIFCLYFPVRSRLFFDNKRESL